MAYLFFENLHKILKVFSSLSVLCCFFYDENLHMVAGVFNFLYPSFSQDFCTGNCIRLKWAYLDLRELFSSWEMSRVVASDGWMGIEFATFVNFRTTVVQHWIWILMRFYFWFDHSNKLSSLRYISICRHTISAISPAKLHFFRLTLGLEIAYYHFLGYLFLSSF